MQIRKQRGFTLIELVVVIVILGILAAFAVPRFMGMEAEARAARVKSVSGNLRAAGTMARGKCLAHNRGAAGRVVVDGQNVTMIKGWPTSGTIERTLQAVWGWTATNPAAGSRRDASTNGGANCWVQYNQSAAAGAIPTIAFFAGTIGVAGVTEQTIARSLATECAT